MRNFILTAGTAALVIAGGLSAQAAENAAQKVDAGPVQQNSQAMKAADQADMTHVSIRQQIQDQLTKIGYSDIKITPSSFYVRATNKQGDPVAMVIGPDSFTTVTEMPMTAAPGGMAAPAATPSVAAPKTGG